MSKNRIMKILPIKKATTVVGNFSNSIFSI